MHFKAISFFQEMHELLGNMNSAREAKIVPGQSRAALPEASRSTMPLSPASTTTSPTPSPEPKQKRVKREDADEPKIILVPAVHNNEPVRVPKKRGPKPKNKQLLAGPRPSYDIQDDDPYSLEARREWREWKRQQEIVTVHREGQNILESIDSNLAAIRKSLEFIVDKLSVSTQ